MPPPAAEAQHRSLRARDILSQRGWEQYHLLLVLYWQPYLDGKVSFDDAIAHLVSGGARFGNRGWHLGVAVCPARASMLVFWLQQLARPRASLVLTSLDLSLLCPRSVARG